MISVSRPFESAPEIFRIAGPASAGAASGNLSRGCFGGVEQKAARRWAAFCENGLLAETQLLQQVVVFGEVLALDVIKKLATAAGHLEKSAAAMEVLAMRAQVLGQVIDPGGEQRDLDVAGAGVLLVGFVLGYDF